MNNFEEQLNKIKARKITQEDQERLWHRIMAEKAKIREESGQLLIFNFNYKKMTLLAGLMLALVLGTGGVVAASDNARPGDTLFGVDLAVEKARLGMAREEKKSELKLRFAEEREEEVREISENRRGSQQGGSASLSSKQSADLNVALNDLEVFINEESDSENEAELRAKLADIVLILEADSEVELEREDGKVKIKIESESRNEVKEESDDSDDSSSRDDSDSRDDEDHGGDDDNKGKDDKDVEIRLDGSLRLNDDQ